MSFKDNFKINIPAINYLIKRKIYLIIVSTHSLTSSGILIPIYGGTDWRASVNITVSPKPLVIFWNNDGLDIRGDTSDIVGITIKELAIM